VQLLLHRNTLVFLEAISCGWKWSITFSCHNPNSDKGRLPEPVAASVFQITSRKDWAMAIGLIERSASAYDYPLLIKNLLHTPLAQAPEQEIVYRDLRRYNYITLHERIGRLASGLTRLGVHPGDTVAIMDWDSHRYLESFFAVPMMGAVLQTVNVRLNSEQILYTLNHSGPKIVLANCDFLPILEQISGRLESVEKFVLITDTGEPSRFDCEYEELLASSSSVCDFPDFDENTRATTFIQRVRLGCRRGFISATANWCCIPSRRWLHSVFRTTRDASTGMMSTCRSPPCSMCMHGAFRTLRRWPAPSKSIPAGIVRACYWH
jgi:hypothetical protein